MFKFGMFHFLGSSAIASQPFFVGLGPQEMVSQVGESACYDECHSYVRGYHECEVFGCQL